MNQKYIAIFVSIFLAAVVPLNDLNAQNAKKLPNVGADKLSPSPRPNPNTTPNGVAIEWVYGETNEPSDPRWMRERRDELSQGLTVYSNHANGLRIQVRRRPG